MRVAIYGMCPTWAKPVFRGLMEADTEFQLWAELGVSSEYLWTAPHPTEPDQKIQFRGSIGIAPLTASQRDMDFRKNCAVPMNAEEMEIARYLGNGNLSEGVRRALRMVMSGQKAER